MAGKEREQTFKNGDQFGAELVYFSQHILDAAHPGLAFGRTAILKPLKSSPPGRLP
jgi:hypothetical protein